MRGNIKRLLLLAFTGALLTTTAHGASAQAPVGKDHSHDGSFFRPWTSTDSLPDHPGHWSLSADVNLIDQSWTVPEGTTDLCLNGKRIIGPAGESTITVEEGAVLNLYDCCDSGAITHASEDGDRDEGSGIWVFDGGTCTMYSGSISGNCSAPCGGGVLVSGGRFELHGGSITDNQAVDGEDEDVVGGGVYVTDGGSLGLFGGSISGNIADCGGGVFFDGDCFELAGAVNVTDNRSWEDATSNVCLELGRLLTVSGLLRDASGQQAALGICLLDEDGNAAAGVFTSGYGASGNTEHPSVYFTSDVSGYRVVRK